MFIKCECINLALEYWYSGIKKYAPTPPDDFYKDIRFFPEMEVVARWCNKPSQCIPFLKGFGYEKPPDCKK